MVHDRNISHTSFRQTTLERHAQEISQISGGQRPYSSSRSMGTTRSRSQKPCSTDLKIPDTFSIPSHFLLPPPFVDDIGGHGNFGESLVSGCHPPTDADDEGVLILCVGRGHANSSVCLGCGQNFPRPTPPIPLATSGRAPEREAHIFPHRFTPP